VKGKRKKGKPVPVDNVSPVLTDIKSLDRFSEGRHVESIDMVIHFQVPDAAFQSVLCQKLLSEAGRVSRAADKQRLPKRDARKQALRKRKFHYIILFKFKADLSALRS
jgi:hypothetical protein